VHHALYGCTWYDRSESFKRKILQVIVRAQRPVRLTAGKLHIVSMQTFAKVSRHRYTENTGSTMDITYIMRCFLV